jgi:recombination protein RecT
MNYLKQIKLTLDTDVVKNRFEEMLGKKAPGFISSVLNAVNNSALLQQATPQSIIMSAAIAATLDLPISNSLGFAAIVPYRDGDSVVAQFQIMWRGLVQLAQRSGQYKRLNTTEVYEGEVKSHNRFTGDIEFDETARTSMKVIGYVAYFKLINGFEKPYYMTVEEVEKHAKKYSKTYKLNKGKWVDDFDAMAKKTVLKLLLSKYGIMSIDMQNAVKFDQSQVKGELNKIEDAEAIFIDNDTTEEDMDQRTPEERKAELKKKNKKAPEMA